MKVLHLDSSILGPASASRAVSAAIIEQLRSAEPAIEVTYRDLAAAPLSHLTLDVMGGPEALAVLDEFLAADVVVIGAAFYNFTIPTQLKAWIDRILVAGATFRYTERGPEGLAGGKRVIVGMARGGVYTNDAPWAPFEHGESLLRTVLGFMGIHDPEFIIAEGLKLGEEERRISLDAALERARRVEPASIAA